MPIAIQIKPKQILHRLSIMALLFSLVSLITEYTVDFMLPQPVDSFLAQSLNLFSVNLEASFPTWYSTLLLFAVAVLTTLITIAKFHAEEKGRWYWGGLVLVFLYLSADEGIGIHEIFADWIQQTFHTTGFFEFGWQIVAIPVVLLVIILYARFIFRLPASTRTKLILAALVYLGGALFVEGISANQWSIDGGMSMRYLTIATIEELMEMLGAIMFIYTVLDTIVQHNYTFAFESTPTTTPRKSNQQRPVRLILPVLVAANMAVIGWMMVIIPHTVLSEDETLAVAVPFYYEIQAQVLADEGTIVEIPGVFGLDNPASRQLGRVLIEQYPIVIAISQPTRQVTTVLATNTLTFNQDELADLLHRFGQTNFILFDTETVRGLSNIP